MHPDTKTAFAENIEPLRKLRGLQAAFRRLFDKITNREEYNSLYYSSRKVIFIIDLLIGITIGYLVYTLEWSYLRERLISFLVWFLSRVDYIVGIRTFGDESFNAGVLIDLFFVTISAVLSTYCRTYKSKITGNIILAAVALAASIYLIANHGILMNSFIIILAIIMILSFNHFSDQQTSRERSRIVLEKKSAEFGVVSHISHSVKPQVLIAKAPLMAVRQYLEKQNLLENALPDKLMDGSHETIGEALDKAIKTINQINDVVANARNLIGREISAEDFEEVDVKEIFDQEIKPLYSNRNLRISVNCRVARKIRLHKASFVEAINNIIRNAETHSFPKDRQGNGANQLSFDIRENVKNVFIDYTNNGLPFPENIDAKAFLTFGRKSSDSRGEGLGGAWIGKVIEAHSGTFEIIRDGKPVHFRITIPKLVKPEPRKKPKPFFVKTSINHE